MTRDALLVRMASTVAIEPSMFFLPRPHILQHSQEL